MTLVEQLTELRRLSAQIDAGALSPLGRRMLSNLNQQIDNILAYEAGMMFQHSPKSIDVIPQPRGHIVRPGEAAASPVTEAMLNRLGLIQKQEEAQAAVEEEPTE